MKKCINCGTKNYDSAKYCHGCAQRFDDAETTEQQNVGDVANKKKKQKKRLILACVCIFVFIGLIGLFSGNDDDGNDNSDSAITTEENINDENAATPVKATTEKETTAKKVSLGNLMALQSAERYLSVGGFSEKSLKEQLAYEQFEDSEIAYAIKNCNADWNQQCVTCAKRYIEMGRFSRGSLYEQLEYEGFTSSQINYALEQVGY